MSKPNTQIRISNRVRWVLDRYRRTDESYNEVIERMLIYNNSDPVSLHHKRAQLRRRARMRYLSTDGVDTDTDE